MTLALTELFWTLWRSIGPCRWTDKDHLDCGQNEVPLQWLRVSPQTPALNSERQDQCVFPQCYYYQNGEFLFGHAHGDRHGPGASCPVHTALQPEATLLKLLTPQTKAASDSSAFVHICIISNANTILHDK